MGKKFIIDHDPVLGMEQIGEVDEDGITIQTRGINVERVLDENKAMASVNKEVQRGTQTWGHHVARIPMWLYMQFCRENPELALGTPDAKAWLVAKLNDGDYAHLKTYDGKV